MSTGAIVMMGIGIIIIWGGLLLSIMNAVKMSRQKS